MINFSELLVLSISMLVGVGVVVVIDIIKSLMCSKISVKRYNDIDKQKGF